MVLWGFPRRFGRFGWEPSQLSSGGVLVKVVVRGSFRVPPFVLCFSLSGFPPGPRAERVGRGGHPESLLQKAGWGRSPGPKPRRWLRAGREPVAVVGGRAGAAGAVPRGAAVGVFRGGLFPPRGPVFPAQRHLRSFSPKTQDKKQRRFCVVFDTSPPRRVRVTRICRSPFSPRRRPRRAGAVFFSRRGAFSGAAPAPPAAAPGAFRGRAVRPAARAPARQTSPLCFGKVRPARSTFQLCFAEVRPPWSAFALCSGEVRPARSALPLCSAKVRVARFRASLWRSPTSVVGFRTLL